MEKKEKGMYEGNNTQIQTCCVKFKFTLQQIAASQVGGGFAPPDSHPLFFFLQFKAKGIYILPFTYFCYKFNIGV